MIVSVEVLPVFSTVSGALAVAGHDIGLRRITIHHLRHVAHVDHAAFHRLDREIVQGGDTVGAAVHLHVVFTRADLGRATGKDQVLRIDGIDHVDGRKALGLQRGGVDIDHDLADLPAKRQRHGGALDGGELRADEAVAEIVERLLGQGVAGQPQLQDGDRRCVVRNDVGRQRARWQHLEDRRRI
jgi:hypothetical protein